MAKTKRKVRISATERARRSRQASINFGHTKSRRTKSINRRRTTRTRMVKRRRKTRTRTVTRTVTRKAQGFLSRIPRPIKGAAFGYGYQKVRTPISNAIARFGPIGMLGDEIGLLVLHTLLYKGIKNNLAREFFYAGSIVEGARLAEVGITITQTA